MMVILNPSLVTLSETKGLVVQLRTGSVKDLATTGEGEILSASADP